MNKDLTWKKDETTYLIFSCTKCKQFSYVKVIQKSKKCLRCGYTTKVSSMLNLGERVYGLSNAIELVKKRQNDSAKLNFRETPELRSLNDFTLICNSQKNKIMLKKQEITDDATEIFKVMLIQLSNKYKKFPYYIIEIFAENYSIPPSEVKLLVKAFLRQEILIQTKGDLFKIKLKKNN
ncbi:MAG: hypothetical protein ACFE9T_06095 [Promethearchaeota archaeon]